MLKSFEIRLGIAIFIKQRKFVYFLLFLLLISKGYSSILFGVEKGFGSTYYRLSFAEPITENIDQDYNYSDFLGESKLEYPLDFYLFRMGYSWNTKSDITYLLSGSFAVTQAFTPMYDTDWLGVQGSTTNNASKSTTKILWKYSYTESSTESLFGDILFGIRWKNRSLRKWKVDWILRAGANFGEFTMYGIQGWQKSSPESIPIVLDTLHNEKVLYYKFGYMHFDIGMGMGLIRGETVSVLLDLYFTPISYSTDYDDHVLRGKTSTSWQWGFGAGLHPSLKIQVSQNVHAILGVPVLILFLDGHMDQMYYRDSEDTPEDERELDLSGIDNIMRLTDIRASFAVEF